MYSQKSSYDIFSKYKPGENVLSDGNCGIYAVCNALNYNKKNKITSILELLELLGLNELPNYWWSDEELAAIAHITTTIIRTYITITIIRV